MNYKFYDTIICSSLIQNPEDGSVYFDQSSNTIWMAFNNQWFKSGIFNKKEHMREELIKKRKEKLNKLNVLNY